MDKGKETKQKVEIELLFTGQTNDSNIHSQYYKTTKIENIKLEIEDACKEPGYTLIEIEPLRKKIKCEELDIETSNHSSVHNKESSHKTVNQRGGSGQRQTQKPRTVSKLIKERGAKPGPSVENTQSSSGAGGAFICHKYEEYTDDEAWRASAAPVRPSLAASDDKTQASSAENSRTLSEYHADITKVEVEESLQRMEGQNLDEEMNEVEPFPSVSEDFLWSADFSSFTGQREAYLREPGPTISSQDPSDIFLQIWDEAVMRMIVRDTNKYAWEAISQLSDPSIGTRIPNYLSSWDDISIEELYRYFALLIYMSICQRSKLQEYWMTGVLGMPEFRKIMTRSSFLLITKFLHFTSNDVRSTGYQRKIAKIGPVLNHCNKKFSQLYIPAQHISLEETLLFRKGRLSCRQCVRSKVARCGIKSFELCEAETGYLLQCRLYAGKDTAIHAGPNQEPSNKAAQVALQLLKKYLDVGHVLVMGSWFDRLNLTRYLKSRRTDVLGTLAQDRRYVPQDIQDLRPERMERGDWVARHCGDIALIAWKSVKLVTVMSTYHQHEMVPGRRTGQAVQKPIAVQEYNRYMGGVDLKDQKLSMFLFERKGGKDWYMKAFKRLINISLLNAFIIYTKNSRYRVHSHREFRLKVAEGLLNRFPGVPLLPRAISNTTRPLPLRLELGNHYADHTDIDSVRSKTKHKRLPCARCTILKKRTLVTLMCKMCQAPLCTGKCWKDYHELEDLSSAS